MTNQEAIDKMEFCKRAYQRMIDENSQEGVFVGKGFEGKWKADTPLYKVYEDMRDACDMAIKALEQEPCEDAISRQATIEAFQMFRGYEANRTNAEWVDRIETIVKKLPPVNPTETVTEFADRCRECGKMRKGHWIYDKNIENWRCSECGETPKTLGYCGTADFMTEHFKFCNHCGCRMVEPQESEDRNEK